MEKSLINSIWTKFGELSFQMGILSKMLIELEDENIRLKDIIDKQSGVQPIKEDCPPVNERQNEKSVQILHLSKLISKWITGRK